MPGGVSVIGLDLGRHSIKAVCLVRRWGRAVFTRAEALPLPDGRADAPQVLRRWLEQMDLLDPPVVVGVSGHAAAILKVVDVPTGGRTAARLAAKMEAEKFARLTSEDLIHDIRVHAPRRGRHRALFVMARSDVIGQALRTPLGASLNIGDAIPAPAALAATAAAWSGSRLPPTLCVDVGYHATEIAITDGGGVCFARHAPFGAGALVDALARALGLPPAQAEERLAAGAEAIEGPTPAAAALQAAAEPLLAELQVALALHADRFPGPEDRPLQLILSGGGSLIGGLREAVAQRVDMPVRLLSELKGLPFPGRPERFAVAAGLALSGAGFAPAISLLPPMIRRHVVRKRQQPYWMAAAAMLIVIGLTVALGRHIERNQTARRLAAEQRQRQEESIVEAKWRRQEEANRRATEALRQTQADVMNNRVFVNVLAALSEAKATQDWITVVADLPAYADWAGMPQKTAPPARRVEAAITNSAPSFRLFAARGYTPVLTFRSVRSLIDTLRRDARIETADLFEDSPASKDGVHSNLFGRLGMVPFTLQVRARNGSSEENEAQPPPSDAPASTDRLRKAEAAWHLLTNRWTDVVRTFSTFSSLEEAVGVPVEEAGRIDFRMALMRAQEELQQTARQAGARFPSELGLADILGPDGDVIERLLQLAAVSRVGAAALAAGVEEVESIAPLPPVSHLGADGLALYIEYPVRLRAVGDMNALLRFIEQISRPGQFLVTRQMFVQAGAPEQPERLTFQCTASALVFASEDHFQEREGRDL